VLLAANAFILGEESRIKSTLFIDNLIEIIKNTRVKVRPVLFAINAIMYAVNSVYSMRIVLVVCFIIYVAFSQVTKAGCSST